MKASASSYPAPPTISMAYVAALLDAVGADPEDVQDLLREAGIAPGDLNHPSCRVGEQAFATLYRLLAVRLDDEMLHLFSRPFRPGALKFTCLALLDAKNLMVALHRWSCLLRLMQDDFAVELQTGTSTARLALVAERGPMKAPPLAMDLMLKVVHGVASWLVGRQLPLMRVDFPFVRPVFAGDYAALYPGPVFFNQQAPALHLDTAWLQQPVRRGKQELNEFLLHAPEGWMFAGQGEEPLSLRMRGYLAERLPLPATAEDAAEALHVSTRTLHRRLSDEGTSFQRVKDELRRDMAVQMLTKSQAPITTISARLGFDSTASFHRAFRGWTGDTPGAFRVGAASSPPPR